MVTESSIPFEKNFFRHRKKWLGELFEGFLLCNFSTTDHWHPVSSIFKRTCWSSFVYENGYGKSRKRPRSCIVFVNGKFPRVRKKQSGVFLLSALLVEVIAEGEENCAAIKKDFFADKLMPRKLFLAIFPVMCNHRNEIFILDCTDVVQVRSFYPGTCWKLWTFSTLKKFQEFSEIQLPIRWLIDGSKNFFNMCLQHCPVDLMLQFIFPSFSAFF